ncbi:hypothetical protein BsWGS_00918 [Bradybaena similaris]
MDLPESYFPVRVCPHIGEGERHRFMFAECGSHENVNITVNDDEESIKFWPQKSQDGVENLSQNIPTLPLFANPLNDQWSEWDHILKIKNYSSMESDLKYLINQINVRRGTLQRAHREEIVKRFKLYSQHIQNYYNSDSSETTQSPAKQYSDLLPMLDKGSFRLLTKYDKASDIYDYNPTCLNGYNRHFYGGLLSVIKSHRSTSADVLIHAGGASFQDIFLTEVSSTHGNKLKQGQILDKLTVDEPVFQLVSSSIHTKRGLICARQKHKCLLLSHKSSHPKLVQKDHIEIPDEVLTSVNFSSYMRNEILASTHTGSVYLWDIQSGSNSRLLSKFQDSNCMDKWSCSYFGGHPREVVLADNTSLSMFDHRSHFNYRTELFSLSSSVTKQEESVMAATYLGFPLHAVVTDYSIFIIDQRFPSAPVLNWSTEFISCPQYIQVLQNDDLMQQEKLLVVASQQPPEVMCFPLHSLSTGNVASSVLPWKVSQIGEFRQSMHTSYTCDLIKAEKRFETSLAGIAVTSQPDGNGFTIYQVDGYGDVFYQPYVHINRRDLYKLASCTEEERQAVDHQAKTWLKAFDLSTSAGESEITCLPVTLAPDAMRNIFRPSEPKVNPRYGTYSSTKRKRQQPSKSVNLHKNLAPLDQLPSNGSSSQLHLALRDNLDITDFLLKREEDHAKLKKKVRKINLKIAKKRRPKQSPKKRIYKCRRKPHLVALGRPPRAPPRKRPKKDTDRPKRKNISKEFCDVDFSSSEDAGADSKQASSKDSNRSADSGPTSEQKLEDVEMSDDQLKSESDLFDDD